MKHRLGPVPKHLVTIDVTRQDPAKQLVQLSASIKKIKKRLAKAIAGNSYDRILKLSSLLANQMARAQHISDRMAKTLQEPSKPAPVRHMSSKTRYEPKATGFHKRFADR